MMTACMEVSIALYRNSRSTPLVCGVVVSRVGSVPLEPIRIHPPEVKYNTPMNNYFNTSMNELQQVFKGFVAGV